MVISGTIAVIVICGVLVFVKSEVDRFIFSMPIFAGWILFNILMLPDEKLDDEGEKKNSDNKAKKKKG